ncbi:hypothetical protein Poly24_42160 [Rosistilla carotiformis]|uniref:Lipopolysaccharide assembly protein A domain-containing protein n=1 Tax=Rosistilla carotiformis TaxID=2528017 RepID=A0A518JY79_9BACT|nr:LapA family protein [Rosistilla carotiformis]QDV70492.1 hypothetical protein Poly24_42160 [Rosistilla carotiformis]
MARLKLILVVSFLLLLVIIAYLNRGKVALNLLFSEFEVPVTILIVVTALIGFAVGVVFGSRIPRKLKVTGVPGDSKASDKTKR